MRIFTIATGLALYMSSALCVGEPAECRKFNGHWIGSCTNSSGEENYTSQRSIYVTICDAVTIEGHHLFDRQIQQTQFNMRNQNSIFGRKIFWSQDYKTLYYNYAIMSHYVQGDEGIVTVNSFETLSFEGDELVTQSNVSTVVGKDNQKGPKISWDRCRYRRAAH